MGQSSNCPACEKTLIRSAKKVTYTLKQDLK